ALLVALLHAGGVRAELVLLNDGPGRDLDRELPGLDAFDHAIVRADVDGTMMWIDATQGGLPAGQLPMRHQGPLALVAHRHSKDLITTPLSSSGDNVVREVRILRLAELDRGSVTETSTETGVFWGNLREWTRDTKRSDLEKEVAGYVERHYLG